MTWGTEWEGESGPAGGRPGHTKALPDTRRQEGGCALGLPCRKRASYDIMKQGWHVTQTTAPTGGGQHCCRCCSARYPHVCACYLTGTGTVAEPRPTARAKLNGAPARGGSASGEIPGPIALWRRFRTATAQPSMCANLLPLEPTKARPARAFPASHWPRGKRRVRSKGMGWDDGEQARASRSVDTRRPRTTCHGGQAASRGRRRGEV